MDTQLEEVRRRVVTQLREQPDTDSWDQIAKDRLLLLVEFTRYIRLSSTPKPNGKRIEYTGECCHYCGSLNMRRTGSCSVCENCGESGGCS